MCVLSSSQLYNQAKTGSYDSFGRWMRQAEISSMWRNVRFFIYISDTYMKVKKGATVYSCHQPVKHQSSEKFLWPIFDVQKEVSRSEFIVLLFDIWKCRKDAANNKMNLGQRIKETEVGMRFFQISLKYSVFHSFFKENLSYNKEFISSNKKSFQIFFDYFLCNLVPLIFSIIY